MGSKTMTGFPTLEAAERLLRALGREIVSVRLRERLQRAPASPDDLPRLLESEGLRSRLVQAEPRDLPVLDVPTLLQLKDESWILLHRATPKGWEVEDAVGLRSLPPAPEALSGTALDRLGVLPERGTLWHRVGRLIADHRRPLAQVLAISALMQGLAMITPLITRTVMDQALPQASRSLLLLAVLGVLLTSLAATGLGLVRDWTNTFVETRLDAISQRGLLDHALRLPFRHLMARTTGELMQAFTGLSTAKDLLSQHLFTTTMDACTALGYLVIMITLWPLGAGLVLAGSLLLALLSLVPGLFQARIQRRSVPVQILERNAMVEMLQGIATLKSAGVESRILARWSGRFLKLQSLGLQKQRVGLWSEVGLDSVRQLLTLALLVEGGRRVLGGELSIGTLFAFQQMAGSLTGAFQGVATLGLTFAIARPQMEKTQELLALTPDPPPQPSAPSEALDLAIDEVWFRYDPEGPWVLKDLTLRVEAGACHWLRWPSGAGKSTLLRLMAGLLEPERGQVRLGGRPARDLRDQVVYLPQGFQLYGTSILENLKILSGQAPLERLMAAAETSGLARLIATLPMGYETLLAQGGSNVSGGQRQLLLLTAAMATERRILLLDEAFANLDWLARAGILQGDWFRGKTVIYASHDAGLTKERVP